MATAAVIGPGGQSQYKDFTHYYFIATFPMLDFSHNAHILFDSVGII